MTRRALIAIPFAAAIAPAPARASQWAQAVAACLACITYPRDKLNLLRGIAGMSMYDSEAARDLADTEAAIERNAGKPLTDWDEAKQELDIDYDPADAARIEELLDELRAARNQTEKDRVYAALNHLIFGI